MERLTRTPVPLDDDDKAELKAAAKRYGINALGDYLRFAGLKVARETDQSKGGDK